MCLAGLLLELLAHSKLLFASFLQAFSKPKVQNTVKLWKPLHSAAISFSPIRFGQRIFQAKLRFSHCKTILCSGTDQSISFLHEFHRPPCWETLNRRFLRCSTGGWHDCVVNCFNEVRKMSKSFGASNSSFFFAYSLDSNEYIGYLNLSDLNETWSKCLSHINTPVLREVS